MYRHEHSDLTLTTILGNRFYYHPHFEMIAWKNPVTSWPKMPSWELMKLQLEPSSFELKAHVFSSP